MRNVTALFVQASSVSLVELCTAVAQASSRPSVQNFYVVPHCGLADRAARPVVDQEAALRDLTESLCDADLIFPYPQDGRVNREKRSFVMKFR